MKSRPESVIAPDLFRFVSTLERVLVGRCRIEAGDTLLAAVSGGADSVAMARALAILCPRLRIRWALAHFNHGIRGRAAASDAAFVRRLARELGVPFHAGQARVPELARRRHCSLEQAARAARYAFLAKAAGEARACAVLTAHTADDQAETVLLRLLRGAGAGGLAGIPVEGRVAGVRVIRPMLGLHRNEVERFLTQLGQAWREDRTNRDLSVPRNRVRHELLPLLEARYNPGIRETLGRMADVLREEDSLLDAGAGKVFQRLRGPGGAADELRLDGLRRQEPAIRRRVIRLWLAEQAVDVSTLDFDTIIRLDTALVNRQGSECVELPGGGGVVQREYGCARWRPAVETTGVGPGEWPIRVPGLTKIPALGLTVRTAVRPGLVKDRAAIPGGWPARASLDLRAATGGRSLRFRTRRPGDRMRPLGLVGSRKVHDVFVDAKVPVRLRDRIPLLVCGEEIVWIPGYRVAAGWEVARPGDRALQIRVEFLRPAGVREDRS